MNMSKQLRHKAVAVILAVAMVFSFVPGLNLGAEEVYAAISKVGQVTVNDLIYDLYDDGTAALADYNNELVDVVIPEEVSKDDVTYKVTAIAEDALSAYDIDGSGYMKTLTIPASVTEIGSGALTNGVYPEKITVVEGNPAFVVEGNALYTKDMTRLIAAGSVDTLVIPATVTTVDDDMFRNRGGIKNIVFKNKMTELPSSLFEQKYGDKTASLESVVLPEGLTTIPSNLFSNCYKITSIEMPTSVTTIASGAFRYTKSLESIVIPKNVTSIGKQAFQGCSKLKTVVLPESVTSLEYRIFQNCSALERLTLSPNMKAENIDKDAFKNATVSSTLMIYTSEDCDAKNSATIKNATFKEWKDAAIETETLAGARVGQSYEQQLVGTGIPAPIWYVIDGKLPAGLTLSKDGKISGTPTEAGAFTFTVEAYNMGTDSKEFTITVIDPAVKINEGATGYNADLNAELELKANVTGMPEGSYHVHWTFDGEYLSMMNNTETVASSRAIADAVVTGDVLKLKAVKAGNTKVVATVYEGDAHGPNCNGEVMATGEVTVNVLAPAADDETTESPTDGSTTPDADDELTQDDDADVEEDATEDKDDATQTGDNINMAPLFALMLAAAAVAVVTLMRRRERA